MTRLFGLNTKSLNAPGIDWTWELAASQFNHYQSWDIRTNARKIHDQTMSMNQTNETQAGYKCSKIKYTIIYPETFSITARKPTIYGLGQIYHRWNNTLAQNQIQKNFLRWPLKLLSKMGSILPNWSWQLVFKDLHGLLIHFDTNGILL